MNLIDKAVSAAAETLEKYKRDSQYPQPLCLLIVDGKDITHAIEKRLININLTDNRGMEADALDISLSDHDGALTIPPRGGLELICG